MAEIIPVTMQIVTGLKFKWGTYYALNPALIYQ